MPVDYKYDKISNFLSTRFYGVLTNDDLINQAATVGKDDRIRSGLREIVDLRDVEGVEANVDSLGYIISEDFQNRDNLKNHRAAIVAPTDFLFGMARMFEMMSESRGGPTTVQVFRTMDEAESWLGIGDPTGMGE